MAYLIKPEKPRMKRVKKVVKETESFTTIFFDDEGCKRAKPGQFVMVWLPSVGEVPMSLSNIDVNGLCSITVKPVGPTTTRLCEIKENELIGIRGPYGKGFTLASGRVLLVGGGVGVAALLPLAQHLVKNDSLVTFIIAAKSSKELIEPTHIKELLCPPHYLLIATEDGSRGVKGLATDLLARVLEQEEYSMVYTCGPEKMMRKVFETAERRRIKIQASLERYIKCGLGICGSCCVGKYLLCKDGPVFKSEQLKEVLDEFGKKKRDGSGRFIEL